MFASLFSSQSKIDIDKKNTTSSGSNSCINKCRRLISMTLGLTVAANSYANSGPSIPEVSLYEQEISLKNPSPDAPYNGTTEITPSLKTPIVQAVQEPKVDKVEPVLEKKKTIAIAQKGDSVGSFMSKNFGTIHGWEGRLLNMRTGILVVNPNTDLIAGDSYSWLESSEKANTFSSMIQKRLVTKKTVTPNTVAKEIGVHAKTGKMVSTTQVLTKDVLKKAEEWGFNFSDFLKSISDIESKGNYNASNEKIGKKLGITPKKMATGGYQFTQETLSDYGIITAEQRLGFQKNPKLQEDIMKRHTLKNMRYMVNGSMFIPLIQSGVQPNQILSAMHHMGAGGVMKIARKSIDSSNPATTFFQKLKSSSDWLGTSTYSYVKSTSIKYDTVTGKAPISHKHKTQAAIGTKTSSDGEKPKTMVTTVSANDAMYTEAVIKSRPEVATIDGVRHPMYSPEVSGTSVPSAHIQLAAAVQSEVNNIVQGTQKYEQVDENQEARKVNTLPIEAQSIDKFQDTKAEITSPEMIEFIPVVGEVESWEERNKKGIIQAIQDDTSETEEYRNELIAKIEKAKSFRTLCLDNIRKYETDLLAGTAKEQREASETLPKLRRLLSKIDYDIKAHTAKNDSHMAKNDSNIPMKCAA